MKKQNYFKIVGEVPMMYRKFETVLELKELEATCNSPNSKRLNLNDLGYYSNDIPVN